MSAEPRTILPPQADWCLLANCHTIFALSLITKLRIVHTLFLQFLFSHLSFPIKLLPTLDPLTLFLSKSPMTLTTNKSVVISQNFFFGPVSSNKHTWPPFCSAFSYPEHHISHSQQIHTLAALLSWCISFHLLTNIGVTRTLAIFLLISILTLSWWFVTCKFYIHADDCKLMSTPSDDLFWSPHQGHFNLARLNLKS